MQYLKLKTERTIIEFHNNLLGVETVIANGIEVSKKSSILGVHHHFTVMEDGESVRYVLTSKAGKDLQCYIDLKRNGILLHEDIRLKLGSKPINKSKIKGLKYLLDYDMEKALEHFEKAADIDKDDPTIYFHMACAYSNLEDADAGFFYLKKAVEYNFPDHELILSHDMLAFLRMHPAFESFKESGFTEYHFDEYL